MFRKAPDRVTVKAWVKARLRPSKMSIVSPPQAMIFCHTRKTAAWLVEKMTKDGHAVALLSGELTVEERIQVSSI